MRAEVIQDRVDALDLSGQPGVDLLQERDPGGRSASLCWLSERRPGRRLEGTQDVALVAAAIVDLLPCAPRRPPRLLARRAWSGPHNAPTGEALGRLWPHLIQA